MQLKSILLTALVLALLACGGKSDAELQSAADKALKEDETTSTVTVKVNSGIATIRGVVTDQAAKAKAEELARVEGVTDVKNEVEVNAPAPPPQASGTDAEIEKKITDGWKTAGCDGASVKVTDGLVEISGEVAEDKYTICLQVVNIAGPKKIENKLTKK